jgi:regulation of enolase protein 1 (concanavalin A-like superfamily)
MLQVYQENGKRILQTKTEGGTNDFNMLLNQNIGSKIWMRVHTDQDTFRFQYSLDGKKFENIGKKFSAYFNNWRAAQIGVFSYNEKINAGFIDVDWFKYDYQ